MKQLIVFIVIGCSLSSSPLQAATGLCEPQAEGIVRSIIAETHHAEVAASASFEVVDSLQVEGTQVITVQAFGLDGEDSDTLLSYSLTFRTFDWEGVRECADLIRISLVDEN